MIYGEAILAERSKRRISQADLADGLGIYKATLVDIERGRINIDMETYNKFTNAIIRLSEDKKTEEVA